MTLHYMNWTSVDGLAHAEVTMHHTSFEHERDFWDWSFTWPDNVVGSSPESRISSPQGLDSAEDVLVTLGSFFAAWMEALEYEDQGRPSENGDLFPRRLRGFADLYGDEFIVDQMMNLEEDYR